MKLACQRCKHKKIKCDREEPSCQQCITAQSDCTYVERRKRPRLSGSKAEVTSLSKRLEYLERQISTSEHESPVPQNESSAGDVIDDVRIEIDTTEPTLPSEEGRNSWIYRMVDDAKRGFEKCNTQPQNTPIDVGSGPHLDNAMSSLNEALQDLEKLRVRPEAGISASNPLDLTTEEASACIEAFIALVTAMIAPNVLTGRISLDILRTLPSIYRSDLIAIDPGLLVLFYNALYFGVPKVFGSGNFRSRIAYKKILESTPAWLETAKGTELDALTAALTTWTSINMLDYHLSWQFHCKSCYFLKKCGIDRLDVAPAKTAEEELSRQDYRYLFFHVLQTDALFRLIYGKPGAMLWSYAKVHPPALFTAFNMQPTASQVIMISVWLRSTISVAETLKKLDDAPADAEKNINEFSEQLNSLVDDYGLETRLRDGNIPQDVRYSLADHIMSILLLIIGMRNKMPARRNEGNKFDLITVKAARRVLGVVIFMDEADQGADDGASSIYHHFVTFFPFGAIFALYKHILSCSDLGECDQDLRSLETIGDIMKRTAVDRKDFLPFCNTVKALNKVTRTMLEEKSERVSAASSLTPTLATEARTPRPLTRAIDGGMAGLSSIADDTQFFFDSMQGDLNDAGLTFLQDFAPVDGEFHPQGLIQALEDDFMGRNWHQSWWDMQGGMDVVKPQNLNGDISITDAGFQPQPGIPPTI